MPFLTSRRNHWESSADRASSEIRLPQLANLHRAWRSPLSCLFLSSICSSHKVFWSYGCNSHAFIHGVSESAATSGGVHVGAQRSPDLAMHPTMKTKLCFVAL
eukprot:scaffold895_cov315-Pinguiococcus_pyrenoidosus.AAC.72